MFFRLVCETVLRGTGYIIFISIKKIHLQAISTHGKLYWFAIYADDKSFLYQINLFNESSLKKNIKSIIRPMTWQQLQKWYSVEKLK